MGQTVTLPGCLYLCFSLSIALYCTFVSISLFVCSLLLLLCQLLFFLSHSSLFLPKPLRLHPTPQSPLSVPIILFVSISLFVSPPTQSPPLSISVCITPSDHVSLYLCYSPHPPTHELAVSLNLSYFLLFHSVYLFINVCLCLSL